MSDNSEGFRRLGIVAGCVAAAAFPVWFFNEALGLRDSALGPAILIVGVPLSFLLGRLVVWVGGWVVGGFKR